MTASRRSETFPVFPLTGTLLLPGTYLPLNIFEPRYRNMVEDALEGDRIIGMIQPEVPSLDNFGAEPADGSADGPTDDPADEPTDEPTSEEEPKLYPVGCKGRIAQHQPQDDGRYLIVLEGLCRFRIVEELEPKRGYRRVEADLSEFDIDLAPASDKDSVDTSAVQSILGSYAQQKGLEIDSDLLETLSGERLVSALSTALPFAPAEKQALLEAYSPEDRADLLATLMGIDAQGAAPAPPSSPPAVN